MSWLPDAIGHSHGATMVYYYMVHSSLFAGGIAINGAADWIKQSALESMSGLPDGLGGSPEQLPELFKKESPIENIQSLQKPLLLVGGMKDIQIPPDINMLPFSEKAKLAGKEVNVLLFQDEGHKIENPANRIRFWNELDKFLK